ncbi:glutathione peroxidase [Paracidovorax cattleyae]|uniref:Glutathione peroxidase n=1 Tax=Paracidovorax cattleyae TaxID=80868 RepID=A0A1H0P8T1_9BURK|nr:glutathione peroxidase [Paracidovorax cattleyae]AVS76083.1 glutathione peroxidase [Paracidovorax cattleyae]MBF9264007.1 glutathione peroxidase [Paracidovorax cattleyae]SDP01098.1 glutathione peroxidase [Paracidovorax cattleyae]
MHRLTAPLILALAASAALPAAAQSASAAPAPSPKEAAPCPAVLRHTMPRLQDEAPQDLCQYKGQVLLVVNTASYCGFTGQYEGLEALHARYKTQGFAVLGFPSNDFAQETGSNAQIADFCSNTFGVRFPMFAKSSVKGADASPFYRELAAQAGEAPRWNFHKYLLDRNGRVVGSFGSSVVPDDPKIVRAVEQQLKLFR